MRPCCKCMGMQNLVQVCAQGDLRRAEHVHTCSTLQAQDCNDMIDLAPEALFRMLAGSSLLYLTQPDLCSHGCLLHLGGLTVPCQPTDTDEKTPDMAAHLYDLQSGRWSQLDLQAADAHAEKPRARAHFGAAVHRTASAAEAVFVAGGSDASTALGDVWQLELTPDGTALSAKRLADLPEPRDGLSLTLQPGSSRLAAVGGSASADGRQLTASMWWYDVDADAWAADADLPLARAYHSAVATESELLIWAGALPQVRRQGSSCHAAAQRATCTWVLAAG
jgi:Galactose oxidase, central domain